MNLSNITIKRLKEAGWDEDRNIDIKDIEYL